MPAAMDGAAPTDSQQLQPISFPTMSSGSNSAGGGGGGGSTSTNASSDYLPGTSSGSNSPPLQSLKREASMATPDNKDDFDDGESAKKRPRKSGGGNLYRRNIKDVLSEEKLQSVTKEAKAEEAERLKRLEQQRKELLEKVFIEQIRKQKELEAEQYYQQQNQLLQLQRLHQLKLLQEEHNGGSGAAGAIRQHATSLDIEIAGKAGFPITVSSEEEQEIPTPDAKEDEMDDPNNAGLHVDDRLNVANADGRVLVNVGHPDTDPDIFLAPQIQRMIKPHQIGGIRFMYDNLIESMERYRDSPKGFGCILAHAMGLGKTMQVVAFTDIFLRHTQAKKVLCIVPINTIQNWLAEFNRWLPPADALPDGAAFNVRPRSFNLYLLNDNQKNLDQRSSVIFQWEQTGGVLLMGYEIFRMLATKTQRKKRSGKKANATKSQACVDLEEEDRDKIILDKIQTVLMEPGPDLVMCDEGHRIKNVAASTSLSLKAISTKRRLVLTGYPLQNNLMEYWCMVDFVRPNYLGNKVEFSNMFERPIQNGQCVDSTPKDVRVMRHRAHVLHEQLKGFVQRRSHTVLRGSLPPKVEYVLLVKMTPMQKAAYKRFMDEVIVNKFASSNPLKAFAVCCKIWNHTDVLYNYMKKRDSDEDLEELDLDGVSVATDNCKPKKAGARPNNPSNKPQSTVGSAQASAASSQLGNNDDYQWAEGLFEDYATGMIENSNKILVFMKILEETIRAGDRLLLFSQSLLTLNLIETFLQRTSIPGTSTNWVPNINYYRLDGSTPSMERDRLINAFNGVHFDKTCNDIAVQPLLFLVSTRAGSLGVNLVGANRVVVFDASWNPCHDSQAVCRVYRYGQVRTSYIYRLVTDSSLERRIYDRQINKQGMSNRVVDEMNPDSHMHTKDMHTLLCLEQDEQVGKVDKATGENIPVNPARLDPEDSVLSAVLEQCADSVTTQPFTHESLLVDRREKRLSAAEKRLAERSFEIEKSAKITYKRSSYAAYYPEAQAQAQPSAAPAPTQGRQSASEAIRNSISLDHVGLQLSRNNYSSFYSKTSSSATPTAHHPNYPPTSVTSSQPQQQKPKQQQQSKFPFEALAKQGVNIQEVYVPRDLQIPTNSNGHPPIGLRAGQKVMLIQTPKGIYLRLNEQIIKIKLPQSLLSQFTSTQPTEHNSPQQQQPSSSSNHQVETIFSQLAQKSSSPNTTSELNGGQTERREGL